MKRRSQLKRSKPLRASKKLRRKSSPRRVRAKSKYRARERATDYMLGVKQLPCAALIIADHKCKGPIEADHAGARGTGRKGSDYSVIPLCQLAHRQRTDFSGPFRTWSQGTMRAFLRGALVQTKRQMLARGFLIPAAELTVSAGGIEITVWPSHRRRRDPALEDLAAELESAVDAWIVADEHDLTRAIAQRLAEDIREEGNLDVRHPDAAPLPVARVASEGDPR